MIQENPQLPRQHKILVVILLALFTAMALLGLQHKGLTYDEADHMRYGVNIIHGDPTRFDDSKMPVSAWNALPGLIAEQLPEGQVREALAGTFASRVPTVLAALLLGLLVYRWARELYGNEAGLLALALFVIDANMLAHSRWATTDLYAALGTTAALYFLWRFMRDGGWRAGSLAALAMGFAQLAKYSGVFLVPLFVMIAAVRHWRRLLGVDGERRNLLARLQLGRVLGYALLFVIVVLLVINAGFLFSKTFTPLGDYAFRADAFRSIQQALPAALPVPVPYPYLEGLDWVLQRERVGSEFGNLYMMGELRAGQGFAGYYFLSYLLKVPLAIQVLFLASLIFYVRRRQQFQFAKNEAFLLLPVAFFFVYFNFFYEATIGIRFLLVAFPMMHIFTASLLASQTAPTKPRRIAIGTALLAGAISVLSWHPHYLSYFNELVPDRKQAYRLLADSNIDWGENGYWIDRWMAEHPGATLEPDSPVTGLVVVGVNLYTGVLNEDQFRWLRTLDKEPVDHIAYSHLVFEITPEDLARLPEDLRPQAQ